ncbi:hypothetical protein TNCT_679211 [Trichonephila clavata]|uniref:Uncharacterized protein n=1 Tax=Trichonephila clavata TaxID=2740835 RepID=A0A8X6HQH1_TRICU|nr:hypothetical protein TNCT_679211 [Trichonephila clavata]
MGVKSGTIIVITIVVCCFLSKAAGQMMSNLDNMDLDSGLDNLSSAAATRKVIEMYIMSLVGEVLDRVEPYLDCLQKLYSLDLLPI